MVSLKITENVIIKVLLAILGSYGDPMEDLTYHGMVCYYSFQYDWFEEDT